MKLCFTESHPCERHIGIEFLGLQPYFIFGIVGLFRVTFRFRFDGMQLNAFTAFLDGLIHLRRSCRCCIMVRYGIQIQNPRIIIGIGIPNGFQPFLVRDVAVIENIIFDFRLMERPGRPCVFLGRARDKRGYG